MSTDPPRFLEWVKRWGKAGLFGVPAMLQRISHLRGMDKPPKPPVVEGRAHLYILAQQAESALECFLELGRAVSDADPVFELIRGHGLYHLVRDKVPALIELSPSHAKKLLVDSTGELRIQHVASQLQSQLQIAGPEARLLWYLEALFEHGVEEYNDLQYRQLHMLQVKLYADPANSKLGDLGLGDSGLGEELPQVPSRQGTFASRKSETALGGGMGQVAESQMIRFLRWSWHASNDPDFLEEVYEVCRSKNPPLWNEMVYVLGKSQQSQEALRLLLTEVKDIRQAIHFVENERDSALCKELWGELVKYSLANKAFLSGILESAGLEYALRLIKEIPPLFEIEHLQRKLLSIIKDRRFQLSLQVGCKDSIEAWLHRERARLYQTQRHGIRVTPPEL